MLHAKVSAADIFKRFSTNITNKIFKISFFKDVMSCSVTEVYLHFRDSCGRQHWVGTFVKLSNIEQEIIKKLTFFIQIRTKELTPWIRVLPEKLKRPKILKKFPAFYGTQRFITAFTRACHLSLS